MSMPLLTRGHKLLIFGSALLCFVGVIGAIQIISHSLRQSAEDLVGAGSGVVSNSNGVVVAPTPSPTPSPELGYTLLLLGKAGANHDGGALTDTILLVRILDSTKKILMLSVPRDLWVTYQGKNGETINGKINSANANGGGEVSKQVVTQVTGLQVDKYLTLDFSGFEQAIDSVGGVDLNVTTAFTDYEYPIAGRESLDCSQSQPTPIPNPVATDVLTSESDLISQGKLDLTKLSGLPAQFPCRYELLHFDVGLQHMDGVRALKFVRSRHSPEAGSDFSRSSRQRDLINAVVTKLFVLGEVTKLPTFFGTLRGHIDTDLGVADLLGFLPRAAQIHGYQVIQAALTSSNYLTQSYTADRQFALFPVSGATDFTAIHNWIAALISPNIKLRYPLIQVEAPESNAQKATDLVGQLTSLGYPAQKVSIQPKTATTSATLLLLNSNVAPETVESIRVLSGVESDHVSQTRATNSVISTDLRILLTK